MDGRPYSIGLLMNINARYIRSKVLSREITRLDIIAYLDPSSNPGSKPQRFSVKIAKVQIQISFRHSKIFLAFLVNLWPKTLFK